MNATELTIDVVYENSYWFVIIEKVKQNQRFFARKKLGKNEPDSHTLRSFFEKLNYKKLRFNKK